MRSRLITSLIIASLIITALVITTLVITSLIIATATTAATAILARVRGLNLASPSSGACSGSLSLAGVFARVGSPVVTEGSDLGLFSGIMHTAVYPSVMSLVGLQVEGDVAGLAPEAHLVPGKVGALDGLNGVNRLVALLALGVGRHSS